MNINEIFCSVQGEGYFTGMPSVFIRTSGCNLKCAFCDTHHEEGKEMTVEEILEEALTYQPRHAVLTGGEPALQKELPQLVDALHQRGFYVQIETNGTCPLPSTIDWITCSPKIIEKTVVTHPHELKVVYQGQDMRLYEERFQSRVWSLQPCDTGNPEKSAELLNLTIDYVLGHPQWRLSLQTHKFIGVR